MKTTVVSGYELPTVGQKGSTISWAIDQNHSEMLVNNKLINESEENITVTLTAKLIYGESSINNINYTVEVKPQLTNYYGTYYEDIQATSGNALKLELRELITETHTKVTTYDDLKEYLQEADEDPNNSNNMILFYTGASVPKTDNMNVWNREHVWAQSLTNNWFGEKGAGADMHHIRPCNPSVNSSRGNQKFGTSSGYYDPSAHGGDFRGDVARILFYLFTRYTEADSRNFTDIAESLAILLLWNDLDPVSETEIIRNNYTEDIQGNRNPFIDNPDYADMIWE